jgi:hypothetical protein
LNYFQNENKKIKKISCGSYNPYCFNLFLTGCYFLKNYKLKLKNLKKKNFTKKKECGKIYSVGNNDDGCIGDGTTTDCKTIKQIQFFKDIFIIDVCCSSYHCLSISDKNDIYSWGYNGNDQLGNGNNDDQLTPIKIYSF